MSYRCGNRDQISFLPASIEESVGTDDPVRAYDAFIDAINITEIGIVYDESLVGNSAYDPSAMLKLLCTAIHMERSSRKLERAVHYNLSFIWLIGGLKPDHKTISKFRRENQEALKMLLKECARVCLKLGLIEGNTLFVDGTKLRANASLANTWTVERCEQALKKIDKRIELILKEREDTDRRKRTSRRKFIFRKSLQIIRNFIKKSQGFLMN